MVEPGTIADSVTVIRSPNDISAFVGEANRRQSLMGSAAFHTYLASVTVELEAPHSGADPYSREYHDGQMTLYKAIAAVDAYEPETYEADNNVSVGSALRDPYPFITRDPNLIGRYMMGVANIVANAGPSVGNRLLEYGPGWGHTSIALARSGFDVTVVDIEPTFLDAIEARAFVDDVTIRTMKGQFGQSPDDGTYNVIVFYECFHHAFEFVELMARLRDLLDKDGRILLAAESIYENYPIPWGVRLDPHAIWAIRSFGWMELAFDAMFFSDLARRNGFVVERHDCPSAGAHGTLHMLRRA